MGMRQYARGRAYDPNRYPITPYYEQGKPVAENEQNKALDKESGLREVVEAQADADEAIIEAIRADEAPEAEAAAQETPEAAEDAETVESGETAESEEAAAPEEAGEDAGEETGDSREDEKK